MRKLVLFVVLILSIGFVIAYGDYYDDDYVFKEKITKTEYFPSKNKVVTTTTYIDYENGNRFPTYDYRHGYSYRATTEYFDDRYEKKYYDYDWGYKKDYREYKKSYDRDYYDYDWGKDVYYKYLPHLRTYEKKWCRHEAPRGQLFYIKCPY